MSAVVRNVYAPALRPAIAFERRLADELLGCLASADRAIQGANSRTRE